MPQVGASLSPHPVWWERVKTAEVMGWDNNLLEKLKWHKEKQKVIATILIKTVYKNSYGLD